MAWTGDRFFEVAHTALMTKVVDEESPPLPILPETLRRACKVPEHLEHHYGGAPAPPSQGITDADLDEQGLPRTGTLRNVFNLKGHEFTTRNVLPRGLSREQAIEVFQLFNAPTRAALVGRGNDPSLGYGVVDPSAPLPRSLHGTGFWGGDIECHSGLTLDGRPWAVNSTIKGRHPLKGHVTRTLEVHRERFYIRTDGVGTGQNFAGDTDYATESFRFLTIPVAAVVGFAQHLLNYMVGPRTFNNLDAAAVGYARRRFGDN